MKKENCEQILEIRHKTSVTIIKEFVKDGVKIQFNSAGEVTGRYSARHTETVDILQKMDGTNEWEVKAMEMTKEGDVIMITGKGTGKQEKAMEGSFKGEVMFMTNSPKLTWLNNTKAWVEGMTDLKNNEATIKVYAEKTAAMPTAAAPMM